MVAADPAAAEAKAEKARTRWAVHTSHKIQDGTGWIFGRLDGLDTRRLDAICDLLAHKMHEHRAQ